MPRIRKHRVAEGILAGSRALRRRQTPAEKKLWRHLCERQLEGFKFRRQMAIGRCVVDFACPAAGIVVEIDGDTHAGREACDEARTRELAAEHYRVVRFTNGDVHERIGAVLDAILDACRKNRLA